MAGTRSARAKGFRHAYLVRPVFDLRKSYCKTHTTTASDTTPTPRVGRVRLELGKQAPGKPRKSNYPASAALIMPGFQRGGESTGLGTVSQTALSPRNTCDHQNRRDLRSMPMSCNSGIANPPRNLYCNWPRKSDSHSINPQRGSNTIEFVMYIT